MALGIEFINGWDIVNVAMALTLPARLFRGVKKSQLSAFYANADLLYKNTTIFDRIMARVFFCLIMFSGLCLILLALLDKAGFLK